MWSAGDVVVGAAARLDPVKDLGTLVRGFARGEKVRAGAAADHRRRGRRARRRWRRSPRELGVADSVTLAGWLDDMDEYYGSLDINALSSKHAI